MFGKNRLEAVGQDRVVVPGSFTTHATTPVIRAGGDGFSVVRAGAGRWTVTLKQPYPAKILAILATVASETLTAPMLAFIDQDTITAGVFEIRTWDVVGGALADDAGSEVHFAAICSDVFLDA